MGVVGVVDGALEEVLVEASDVVVGLDLTSHVVAVESKSAHVLAHLVHRLEGLHHLGALVQDLLFHRHRLPRRRWLISRPGGGVRSRCLVT